MDRTRGRSEVLLSLSLLLGAQVSSGSRRRLGRRSNFVRLGLLLLLLMLGFGPESVQRRVDHGSRGRRGSRSGRDGRRGARQGGVEGIVRKEFGIVDRGFTIAGCEGEVESVKSVPLKRTKAVPVQVRAEA